MEENYEQPRQNVIKQRYYFANNVLIVKVMVLPVVLYGYETWTMKKAEQQRIDAFDCGVGEDS